MTAPVASKIVLPTDAGNSGPKVQTQYEVIGGENRHAHFFIARSRRLILGLHGALLAVQSVQAAAQNPAANAFAWLQIPIGGTVRARLRRCALAFTIAGEADMQSVPRIALARFTFTGTASGAEITPAKRATADAAPVVHVRTAVTGMTVTLVALASGVLVPTFGITTSGANFNASGQHDLVDPRDEEEFIEFGPGEGLVLYQPDAATAADTRRFSASLAWDEYDAA